MRHALQRHLSLAAAATALALVAALPALAADETPAPTSDIVGPSPSLTSGPIPTGSDPSDPPTGSPEPTGSTEPTDPPPTPTEPAPTTTPAPTPPAIAFGATLDVRFTDGDAALDQAIVMLVVEYPDGGIQAWRSLTGPDGTARLVELPYPTAGAAAFDWQLEATWSGTFVDGSCRIEVSYLARQVVPAAEGDHRLELTPDEANSSSTDCDPATPPGGGDSDDGSDDPNGGGGSGDSDDGRGAGGVGGPEGPGGGAPGAPRTPAPELTPPLTDLGGAPEPGRPTGLAAALAVLAASSLLLLRSGRLERARG